MKAYGLFFCFVLGVVIQPAFSEDYLTKDDIAYCEENYGQYKLIGDYDFLERERRTIEARVCVHLYNDPLWSYSGGDREDKLLKRGNYYVDLEIQKSYENAANGTIPQEEKPISDLQKAGMRILELEKKVNDLEVKVAKKDAVINEQVKVILDLVSKVKSTLFDQASWFTWKL